MSPIKRTGLALCLLVLAFAGGSSAIKAKSKPEPAKPAVVQTPQPPTQEGLVKALEARVVSLEAELKERKQAANYHWAKHKEYKALCQRQNNYQQVSGKGSWQKQCNGNTCKLVWVPESKPEPAKQAAPVKQASNCATGNCAPATSRRVFAGRWFR